MQLGNFSISLAVKDIQASKAFYEKLGFKKIHGDESEGWVILQSPDATIGLFQGMFEKNMLTFNPGWDRSGNTLRGYTDIRKIQKRLKKEGITIDKDVEKGSGPASLSITDPDGNPILIDQHIE